jgi:hypothetical protein
MPVALLDAHSGSLRTAAAATAHSPMTWSFEALHTC